MRCRRRVDESRGGRLRSRRRSSARSRTASARHALVPPRPAEPDAAASTFDAVLYTLQHDGEAALVRQSGSLAELSVRQLESLITSLKRRGVDETLLLTLAELLP